MRGGGELHDQPVGVSDAPWMATNERDPEATACLSVWASVVDQARRDLADDREIVRNEARHWISNESTPAVGSFQWVCDVFGVDVDRARHAMLKAGR